MTTPDTSRRRSDAFTARSTPAFDRLMADATEEFRDLLETRGVHAALRFLNAASPHRFTGIHRFDDPFLRSVRLFDRENPTLEIGADAPLSSTYCGTETRLGQPFRVDDTMLDPRLSEHPARASTRSYCGVPLGDRGTLCSFDVVRRAAEETQAALLVAAAPLLLAYLRAHAML